MVFDIFQSRLFFRISLAQFTTCSIPLSSVCKQRRRERVKWVGLTRERGFVPKKKEKEDRQCLGVSGFVWQSGKTIHTQSREVQPVIINRTVQRLYIIFVIKMIRGDCHILKLEEPTSLNGWALVTGSLTSSVYRHFEILL